jgi:hypothetical protein
MRVKNPLRLCGELSLRNVLGRGSAALGLIVLAFPGGEDGSRPERKKFLGQIFYCPAYCIGNDMIAVGGKDKGEGMKDKTVIVIRDRVRKARFENSQNVKITAISLRRRIGTSGLIWGLWKACVYLAAIASWDIFSATPSGNGLSPVLRAVPNLSISHDETFSLGAGASFAAVCNLSA